MNKIQIVAVGGDTGDCGNAEVLAVLSVPDEQSFGVACNRLRSALGIVIGNITAVTADGKTPDWDGLKILPDGRKCLGRPGRSVMVLDVDVDVWNYGGVLKPGDKLPSAAAAARLLGVTTSLISQAFNKLSPGETRIKVRGVTLSYTQ